MENQIDKNATTTPTMDSIDLPAKAIKTTPTVDVKTTGSIDPVAVDSSEAVVKTLTLAVDKIVISNSIDDKSSLIINSSILLIPNADEIQPIQQESIVQLTQLTTFTENIVTVDEKPDVDPKISEKSLEPEVETLKVVNVLDDILQRFVNEEDCDEKEQQFNMDARERSPDGESSSDKGLVDDEEDVEGEEESVEGTSAVPVPVDDDTNDPQYIPRRGKFYEHDDRMAYSTTSSEGSDTEYEEGSEDDGGSEYTNNRRRLQSGSKKRRPPISAAETSDKTIITATEGTTFSKKVLEISKVVNTIKDLKETSISSVSGSVKKSGSRKSRDIDTLDKWTHDMYNEFEQTRKTRDELLASYGYDIREESEAPRARRHHKYGRSATAKYTRNWQDTKAYNGTSEQTRIKRGGMGWRSGSGSNKNKNNSITSEEYTSEYPSLDGTKSSESTVASVESPIVSSAVGQQNHQQPKTRNHQEKKTVTGTGPSRNHGPQSRFSTKFTASSPNQNLHQDQQNGGHPSSSHNKNYFNRLSTDNSAAKEKNAQDHRDSPLAATTNSNLFNRRSQPQHSGHNHSSDPKGPSIHQHHSSQPQFNRDRNLSKGVVTPHPSNDHPVHHYDQIHTAPTTAGTGRTQHSGGHYHHYNNRHYENEQIETSAPPSQPIVRSSKRYTVQSNRELPDPVLNFNVLTKGQQPQPPSVSQHQQPNGLVMQEQQLQPQLQQQPIQIHQQPPIQIQQYHQPMPQIHHGMVLDHNTGMMVMAAPDPSMYHHQIYAAPQYATGPGGPAVGADDPNAVAAAAALQMLAQAAVYQTVPTGATGVTSSSASAQQQPESFMTTYYQPQQQPQQHPPPRRVNLAIPIIAPPPESNQQQNAKTSLSSTPPPTTASTN